MQVTIKFLNFTNRIMLMYSFAPGIFFKFYLFLFPLDTVKEKIYKSALGEKSFNTSPLGRPGYLFLPRLPDLPRWRCSGQTCFNSHPQQLNATDVSEPPESEPDPGYINHAKKTEPVSSIFSRGSPAPLPRQDCTKQG